MGCFLGDSLVTIESNSKKSIRDIDEKDIVLTYNEESTDIEYKEVRKKLKYDFDDNLVVFDLSNGKTIKTTTDHPYFVDGDWKAAGKIEVGDELKTVDEKTVSVTSVTSESFSGHLYNFEVLDNRNYFVDGFLVHNIKDDSLGVEEAVTISGSLGYYGAENSFTYVSHASMSVGDKVLSAQIAGLPDSDLASEYLIWDWPAESGSISEAITLVTSSIDEVGDTTHESYLIYDVENGRSDTFKITPNHPLLMKSGSVWYFEYAGEVDTSHKLLSSSLEEVAITSITPYTCSEAPFSESFRRFDIEPQDTYFVDGVLVHN